MNNGIPVVRSSGHPYERGLQIARQAGRRIAHTIDAYARMFQAGPGLGRDQVLSRASSFQAVIGQFAPSLLQEMQGMADGLGRELGEILAINARTELLYGSSARTECTSLAADQSASADGHVYLAQNWDWHPDMAGGLILSVIQPDSGHAVVTLTEAGMVGKIGVNSAGLAMCVNLLTTDGDHAGPAVPMHVILRHLLDRAANVEDAIALLQTTMRCTSCNHLLADSAGSIADVEATPRGVRVIAPTDGLLVHANHCDHPDLRASDTMIKVDAETIARGARMAELTRIAPLDGARIQAILADHALDRPICLHDTADVGFIDRGETVAAVVFDLTERTISLADGQPCSASFDRSHIDELTGVVLAR